MWTFFLQTFSVSIVALLLLFIKWIFADKLSPRWQYGIWTILALRILIPVSMFQTLLLPIPIWVEVLKSDIELVLDSAYSSPYVPILTGMTFLSESISNVGIAPQSITDWLFVIYLVGIVVCLLWYLISYYRLKRFLRYGMPASQAQLEQIHRVYQRYNLNACNVMTISGLHSAFICGILHPVLVLPNDKDTDDMVILHELLHLKYHDAFQNIFWCILRALHWCNPFLHWIFNCIENDMESLCDQRVLELLQGEQRREYGKILLSMVNEPYARTVGTTSLSNGGKNISKRITAIVRFKKFPRGMALVSICIAVLIGNSVLIGTAITYKDSHYFPAEEYEILESFAVSRLNRCTTIAGALDTYAKGLMYGNPIYLATASSLSKQEDFFLEYERPKLTFAPDANYFIYNEETGFVRIESNMLPVENSIYDDDAILLDPNKSYAIYNLVEVSKDCYEALLCFATMDYGNQITLYETGILIIPVRVSKDTFSSNIYSNDTWIVEQIEPYNFFCFEDTNINFTHVEQALPVLKQFTITGTSGTITLSLQTSHHVSNDDWLNGSPYIQYFDEIPKTSETFLHSKEHLFLTYQCNPTSGETLPTENIVLQIQQLSSLDDIPDIVFPDEDITEYIGADSSDGYHWIKRTITEDWNQTIKWYITDYTLPHDKPTELENHGWLVKVLWDGNAVEVFTIGEENLK